MLILPSVDALEMEMSQFLSCGKELQDKCSVCNVQLGKTGCIFLNNVITPYLNPCLA